MAKLAATELAKRMRARGHADHGRLRLREGVPDGAPPALRRRHDDLRRHVGDPENIIAKTLGLSPPADHRVQLLAPVPLHRRHRAVERLAISPSAPRSSGLVASAAATWRPRRRSSSVNTVPPSSIASEGAGGNSGRPPSRMRRTIAARKRGVCPRATPPRPRRARPSARSDGSARARTAAASRGCWRPAPGASTRAAGVRSSASSEPGTLEARLLERARRQHVDLVLGEPAGEVAAARGRRHPACERQPGMGERERQRPRVHHHGDLEGRPLEQVGEVVPELLQVVEHRGGLLARAPTRDGRRRTANGSRPRPRSDSDMRRRGTAAAARPAPGPRPRRSPRSPPTRARTRRPRGPACPRRAARGRARSRSGSRGTRGRTLTVTGRGMR